MTCTIRPWRALPCGGEDILFRRRRGSDGGDEPRIPGFLDFALIGSGGFSKVYTAYQERLARTVAVKVVTVDLSPEASRRFEREQQTAGQLDGHPNVIRIYESGFTEGGRPYLVMEHHAQGSLADRLRRHGPLAVADVLDIGIKLADALAAAHRRGVVHRDVKPHNVLMSPFAGPVLADFGIAALDPGRFTVTTEAFSVSHAAPEVLGGEPATPAADLYSLASVLYELLSGRPPFSDSERPELLALMRRVQQDPIPAIGRPDLPASAEVVLLGLMARDPAARPRSGTDFAEELRRLQHALGLATTGSTTAASSGRGPAGADDASMWRPPSAESVDKRDVAPDEAPGAPEGLPAQPAPIPSVIAPRALADTTIVPPPRDDHPLPDGTGAGGDPPHSGTVIRSQAPVAAPPPLTEETDHRSRWGWYVAAAVLAVALGAGFAVVRNSDDETAEPETRATTTTLPLDRVGPCPPDAEEQLDLELNDPTLSYDLDEPPTNIQSTVDPADDKKATITWTDVNKGRAMYVVLVRCTGAEQTRIPIGKALPGEAPSVVVSGLDPFNYCFSVFAYPTSGSDDDPVLGKAATGGTEACLDA